jgi:CRISPR-associated Csx2 family protein
MTTLISFLGKGRADVKSGYRFANYKFDDGIVKRVKFFGLALTDYLQPERLILVGTAGSMWDVFFEGDREVADDETIALMDAVEHERVDADLLETHAKHLEGKLGIPVECLLIPYARTTGEQVAVLEKLADKVGKNVSVSIDVTHSFRHLPMLALVAARYLAHVSHVKVEELYYGALDMTSNEETPVVRLSGLLKMLDWVEALATYDKDGDYGVFSPLLQDDGMEAGRATLLAKAAFFERTSNPVKARAALSTVFPSVEAHQGELGKLFKGALSERINWYRQANRHEWEASLARASLERSDFLRASQFMYESVVTKAVADNHGDESHFAARDEAIKALRSGNEALNKLTALRNAMAHGLRSNDQRDDRALETREALAKQLRQLANNLLKP